MTNCLYQFITHIDIVSFLSVFSKRDNKHSTENRFFINHKHFILGTADQGNYSFLMYRSNFNYLAI